MSIEKINSKENSAMSYWEEAGYKNENEFEDADNDTFNWLSTPRFKEYRKVLFSLTDKKEFNKALAYILEAELVFQRSKNDPTGFTLEHYNDIRSNLGLPPETYEGWGDKKVN